MERAGWLKTNTTILSRGRNSDLYPPQFEELDATCQVLDGADVKIVAGLDNFRRCDAQGRNQLAVISQSEIKRVL